MALSRRCTFLRAIHQMLQGVPVQMPQMPPSRISRNIVSRIAGFRKSNSGPLNTSTGSPAARPSLFTARVTPEAPANNSRKTACPAARRHARGACEGFGRAPAGAGLLEHVEGAAVGFVGAEIGEARGIYGKIENVGKVACVDDRLDAGGGGNVGEVAEVIVVAGDVRFSRSTMREPSSAGFRLVSM